MSISWRQQVRILEKRVSLLEEEKAAFGDRVSLLEKENLELRKRLAAYENAHTPPSKALKKKQKPKKDGEGSGRLGGPSGHPRYTRTVPEVTKKLKYELSNCLGCGSELGASVRVERRVVEEIPETPKLEVIEYSIYHYKCSTCGIKVKTKTPVPQGQFGHNLEIEITLDKVEDRLTLMKIRFALKRKYGIDITDSGILNILKRMAKLCTKNYNAIIKRIRKADVLNVDETGIKLNGKQYYAWFFVSKSDVLIVIRNRSKEVLDEVLGKNFKGTIICDGYSAYSKFTSNIQRCWAHIIREFFKEAETNPEAEGFFEEFNAIFTRIKEIRKHMNNKPPPLKIYQEIELRLKQLIEQLTHYKKLRKLANKLQNGMPNWLTCLKKSNVEPTNNLAEQTLRELVIQRKISPTLRSKKGVYILEVLMSTILTIKKRNQPLVATLKKLITQPC